MTTTTPEIITNQTNQSNKKTLPPPIKETRPPKTQDFNLEITNRRRRAADKARHRLENELISKGGAKFNFNLLSDKQQQLLDWFFDAEYDVNAEYQGLTASEVSTCLAYEYLPIDMSVDQLCQWIKNFKKAVKKK